MWDLIVSVPDHCLSFYFKRLFRKYGASNVNETFRFDASIDIKARYPSILFRFVSDRTTLLMTYNAPLIIHELLYVSSFSL